MDNRDNNQQRLYDDVNNRRLTRHSNDARGRLTEH